MGNLYSFVLATKNAIGLSLQQAGIFSKASQKRCCDPFPPPLSNNNNSFHNNNFALVTIHQNQTHMQTLTATNNTINPVNGFSRLFTKSLVTLMAVIFSVTAFAQTPTTWFSKSTATNFASTSSWGPNADGSGVGPSSISGVDSFVIANGSLMTLDADATVGTLTIATGRLTVGANTLTIANSNANAIANRLGLPLYRQGMPIFDRLGNGFFTKIGYRGTMQLLFDIGNLFLAQEEAHAHRS
jgi:hypothetical protein